MRAPGSAAFAGISAAILAVAVVMFASAQSVPRQSQETFRSGVAVVPVDVRVVDERGRPVTGLRPQDFTLTEDGIPQDIIAFSSDPGRDLADDERRDAAPAAAGAARKRVFLLVFDRGRQTGPAKAVEAAIDFMRTRLRPEDQVAIVAYTRATVFTTDRAAIVATLEGYRKVHDEIELGLEERVRGGAHRYGCSDLPEPIRHLIDSIFRAPGALPSRSVYSAGIFDTAATPERRIQAHRVRRGRVRRPKRHRPRTKPVRAVASTLRLGCARSCSMISDSLSALHPSRRPEEVARSGFPSTSMLPMSRSFGSARTT